MTVGDILAHGAGLLRGSSESPRIDALLLLERTLARPREWIVAHGEASSDPIDVRNFLRLCERRAAGTPLAYVLGSAGFYGRDFVVSEAVLVPRPETEHLIDEAIAFIKALPPSRVPAVLDVGTGSGAIACTIAAEASARVDGTDISPAAVAVATENAGRLGLSDRCRFFTGDLIAPVVDRRYDVIVANLPYMPSADIPGAPNPLAFEPRVALDGGPDGLRLYRELVPALPPLLNSTALVLLEAAPPTITGLRDLTAISLNDFTVGSHADYAGLARYVKALRESGEAPAPAQGQDATSGEQ